MRLNWPEPLLQLFSWLSFVNFNVELVSPECLVTGQSFDFSFKMKLSLSIPLFALIFALSVPLFKHIIDVSAPFLKHIIDVSKPSGKKSVDQIADGTALVRVFKGYMSFLNLLFVHVATSSLAMFDCTKEADNLSYLDSDPSLRCYESWYYQDLPYAMAGLCCYVLGIPVVSVIFSYAARRARDTSAKVNSIWDKFQLFSEAIMNTNHEFKTDYQFMSVVQLFQKLFLVVVNIFFTRYVGLQIILTLLFLFCSVELVARWRPYQFPVLNKFDILSNVTSMLVLGFGLTFHFDRLSNSLHGLVIIILIIVFICGFIAWVVGTIIRESFSNLRLTSTIIRESFSNFRLTTEFARFRKSNAESSKVEVSEINVHKTSEAFFS
ncbi:hypothetical protein BKA69DRAFT_1093477 [Paraphysoderma sedebokerense]|nr:hypothetical protein BKA69DRAFT_1093477 [Paraphysoderma sedebokerense]